MALIHGVVGTDQVPFKATADGSISASTGGLTNTELRASAVPVSGPVTDAQLRATPVVTTTPAITATTLLNAVIATGAGTAVAGTQRATFQLFGTVSTSTGSATVLIEGSNDNVHWSTLDSLALTLGTTATMDFGVVVDPWLFVRGNVTALTGTDATVTLIRAS